METLTIKQVSTYTYTFTFTDFYQRLGTIPEPDAKQLWKKVLEDPSFASQVCRGCYETANNRHFHTERTAAGRIVEVGEVVAFEDGDEMDEIDYTLRQVVDEVYDEYLEQWEDVYYEGPFVGFCGEHPHLQDFKAATFFQTYGGGPEGGYIRMPDGSVYSIQRTWGDPFSLPERVDGKLEVKKIDGNWKCRVRKES